MEHEFSRLVFEKKKKKAQILNVTKIRLLEAELFHAEGRTDGEI
jgi:hypothetical protein